MQARKGSWLLTDPRTPTGNERPRITLAAFAMRAAILLTVATLVLTLVLRNVVAEQANASTEVGDGADASTEVSEAPATAGRLTADDPLRMVVRCPAYEIVHTDGGLRCARGPAPVPGTLGLRMARPAEVTFVCDCASALP
jgi:hypothetical protein